MTLPAGAPHGAGTRYGYFVVQVRSEAGENERKVSGVLEHLRTGERKEFTSPLTSHCSLTSPSSSHASSPLSTLCASL